MSRNVVACWFLIVMALPGCSGAESTSDAVPVDTSGDVHDVASDIVDEALDAHEILNDVVDVIDETSEVVDVVPDTPKDAWEPACQPEDNPGQHQPGYDNACKGNVGCTKLTCAACTDSCVLCDGPRCVGVVNDDSCLTAPGYASAWADEPLGGVAAPPSEATLTVAPGEVDNISLSLETQDSIPTAAKWLDAGGSSQSRLLVAPVVRVADRVLVGGKWSMTNYCTGQVLSGTVGPQLIEVVIDSPEHATANLPFTNSEPWIGQVAWIRVFEDASGVRAFQWFQPADSLVFGYGATPTTSVTATEPIPADMAKPLGLQWGEFDWAAMLAIELPRAYR